MSFVLLGGEEGIVSMGGSRSESSQAIVEGLPSFHPQSLALLRSGWIQSHAIPFPRDKEKQREMQRKKGVKADSRVK